MSNNSNQTDLPNRQSLRLPEYDYRSPGAYFVTVCAADRQCLFGTVVNGEMRTNDYGVIVAEEWHRTEQVRDRVAIDTFVVMPISTSGRFTERSEVNHTHGVIIITDPPDDTDDDSNDHSQSASNDDVGDNRGRDSPPVNPYHGEKPHRTFGGAIAGSLSTIMRQFKSMVTKRINRLRDAKTADVWQRNFYERVVRNRDELQRIRQYIRHNPCPPNEEGPPSQVGTTGLVAVPE